MSEPKTLEEAVALIEELREHIRAGHPVYRAAEHLALAVRKADREMVTETDKAELVCGGCSRKQSTTSNPGYTLTHCPSVWVCSYACGNRWSRLHIRDAARLPVHLTRAQEKADETDDNQ